MTPSRGRSGRIADLSSLCVRGRRGGPTARAAPVHLDRLRLSAWAGRGSPRAQPNALIREFPEGSGSASREAAVWREAADLGLSRFSGKASTRPSRRGLDSALPARSGLGPSARVLAQSSSQAMTLTCEESTPLTRSGPSVIALIFFSPSGSRLMSSMAQMMWPV